MFFDLIGFAERRDAVIAAAVGEPSASSTAASAVGTNQVAAVAPGLSPRLHFLSSSIFTLLRCTSSITDDEKSTCVSLACSSQVSLGGTCDPVGGACW